MTAAIRAGFQPTAEQQADFSAAESRIMAVAGESAEIKIKGVLTAQRDIIAMIFGGGNTTYSDIVQAIAAANANPNVKDIVLNIDSPGGSVDGMIDAMAAIQTSRKPITTRGVNKVASAAYGLATQTQRITAANKMTRFGSVGVAAGFRVDDSLVELVSTNAPAKRPDVKTEEGRAMVVAELDAMHDVFVEAIATGRGTTIEKVNADFGRGGTLLAEEAQRRGMIDAIAQPIAVGNSTNTASSGGNNTGDHKMDLDKLRAEHPDVYQAAVKVGTDAERDRTTAHLVLGEQSGAMDIAVAAIKDGSGMTATLNAKYLAAGMSRRDLDNRESDNADASSDPDERNEEQADTARASIMAATLTALGVQTDASN